MYRVFRLFVTWSLLALGSASAAEWKLSEWDTWKGEVGFAHRAELWNLWFGEVTPWVASDWDALVWDWNDLPALKFDLPNGHKLVKFTWFDLPGKWVGAWVNTWWDGKAWDLWLLWTHGDNGWTFWPASSAHDWAWHVLEKWEFTGTDGENALKALPSTWPALLWSGHANAKLKAAGKWHFNWFWSWHGFKWAWGN